MTRQPLLETPAHSRECTQWADCCPCSCCVVRLYWVPASAALHGITAAAVRSQTISQKSMKAEVSLCWQLHSASLAGENRAHIYWIY